VAVLLFCQGQKHLTSLHLQAKESAPRDLMSVISA
jgi:hypothetical protein